VAGGELSLDLDPAVFGSITAADVFSATGDQVGTANIQDRQVDVQFQSATLGIGRLPGLPVLTVTIPVLSTAAPGSTSTINVNVKTGVFQSTSAILTVGGALSVATVSPGGGWLASGAVVKIAGTAFTAATAVTIDGAALANTRFISPQEVDITLAAAADLTGKRVLVVNADGSQSVFYSALRGSYVQRPTSSGLATIQPIFPQQLYQACQPEDLSAAIALQNPLAQPVDVEIETVSKFLNGDAVTGSVVTLPPYGIDIVNGFFQSPRPFYVLIVPRVPIRMMQIAASAGGSAVNPIPVPVLQPFLQVDGNTNATYPDVAQGLSVTMVWNAVAGGAQPTPQTFDVVLADLPAPFTIVPSTQSGGQWLSVSPQQGTTCNFDNCAAASKVVISVDPSSLSPGVYNGSLTVTAQGFGTQPTVIPVVFNVFARPPILLSLSSLNFGAQAANSPPLSGTVQITSNAGPIAFSVSVTTQSGQAWLSASPANGTTPATLTITANPAALPSPGDTGTVTVQGPSNVQTVGVVLQLAPPQPNNVPVFPASLVFTGQTGQPKPAVQDVGIPSTPGLAISTQTSDGGTWLSAAIESSQTGTFAAVAVDQTGLAPGVYRGTVIVTPAASSALNPGLIPVTFSVWAVPPPITVTPSALNLTTAVNGATISIATGNISMPFDIATSGDSGLTIGVQQASTAGYQGFSPAPTPTTAAIAAYATVPGVYHGQLTVTAPPGSSNTATVPITLTASAPAGSVPLAASVVNAASQAAGAVSPGEIVTIFGQGIGPPAPAGFALGPDGKVATNLGGTQVSFGAILAPVLYASYTQVNVIVPYEISGATVTDVQLQCNGNTIPAGGLPVAPSTPGIFTMNSTGQGAAAVLNEDNSLNAASSAAARGSIIQIFATGDGETSPPGDTGSVTGTDTKAPKLLVGVTIGGAPAAIIYAASAPDAVSGLFQVNAVVPPGIAAGAAVPLVLKVGDASSQANTTIAVK
jgi:uncharacterized protein (TIGR03437 family)